MSANTSEKSPVFVRINNDKNETDKNVYMIYDKFTKTDGKETKEYIVTTSNLPSIVVNYRKGTKKDFNESYEVLSLKDTTLCEKISRWVMDKFSDFTDEDFSYEQWKEIKVKAKFSEKSQAKVDAQLKKFKDKASNNVDITIDNSKKDVKIIMRSIYVDLSNDDAIKATITVQIDNVTKVKCEEANIDVVILERYVDLDL